MQDEIKKREERKLAKEKKANEPYDENRGKHAGFIDLASGNQKEARGNEFASRSPAFNRKKYPYLSEREFRKKKP